ncbi:MAG: transcription antitermination factor NusB [Tepidamorphaceae bacterium]
MTNPRRPRPYKPKQTPGLAVRHIAAEVIHGVLRQGKPFDATLEGEEAHAVLKHLNARDRGLATMLCQTALRQLGLLRAVLARRMDKPLQKRAGKAEAILLVGAAQILFLDVPSHAAVDLAVQDAAADRDARHFRGLVNAVLRAIAADPQAAMNGIDPIAANTPDWLAARWVNQYGAETASAIMAAHAGIPAIDLSVKTDPEGWARKLDATALANGSVRLAEARGSIDKFEGYAEGAWWVQDAAASLPARLLGDVSGLHVADLAAAPGGKTAQLASAGAKVTAVDRSPHRLERLKQNLSRLGLIAETIAAEISKWQPKKNFDAILLDAPCSATGTIRRHPDIPWLRRKDDFAAMHAVQVELLCRAAEWLKPGGRMVYATCSLEREEGEDVISAALGAGAPLRVDPVSQSEIPGIAAAIMPDGFLRTRPDLDISSISGEAMAGMDGFFAARLIRS